MKKTLLLLLFLSSVVLSDAQNLSYNQLQRLFKTWMSGKGRNVQTITAELRAINPKWKILSTQPSDDKGVKSYAWTAVEPSKDTAAIAVYIDEDETTIKYSLRYAYHSLTNYQAIARSLNSDSYYKGKITTFTDNAKGEIDITGHASDDLPMDKRVDFLLSDYNLNSDSEHPRLFTVDIDSRYIPKQTN